MIRFKKTPGWVVRFILLLGYHHILFFVLPMHISSLRGDYCIWNRLATLQMILVLLAKNGRITNWFGLFYSHNPIKWDNICHYKCKLKFDIKKQIIYSVGNKYTPSSCTYILWKVFVNDIFSYILKNLGIVKYPKFTTFFILVEQLPPWKNFQMWHCYLFFRINMNGCIWIKSLYSRSYHACFSLVKVRCFSHVRKTCFLNRENIPNL